MSVAAAEQAASSLDAISALVGLRPAGAGPARPGTARYGLVSGRSGPRFLVPLDHPDASPQACLAYLGLRDLRTRVSRGAAGLALRAGLGRFVIAEELEADAGPDSLLGHLGTLLDDPEHGHRLAVAIGLGHHDEVWKPTFQVFRPDGEPAAFVKVGLGPVADHLVATEAATLATWGHAADPRLVVPELLAESRWDGLRLAVVAPLPTDARRLPAGQIPAAWPAVELDGPVRELAPADAPWWQGRRAANADHPDIDALLDRIEQRHRAPVSWGRWHGDWVPWNLARCSRGLVAWDWEHSEPGAPVGLDEVHGAYQVARVVEGQPIAEALRAARATADRLVRRGSSPLSPVQLQQRAGTPAAAWHRADAAAPPADLGAAASWLADVHVAMLVTRSTDLERRLGRPPADRGELLTAAAHAVGRASEP